MAYGAGVRQATFSIEGLAAAITLDIHLQDGGVMDEAIDGRERHGLVGEACSARWSPKALSSKAFAA